MTKLYSELTISTSPRTVSSNGVTIVELDLISHTRDGIEIVATGRGVAKRDPIDDNDPELGYTLAYVRALEVLTHRLGRQVDGALIHQDDVVKSRVDSKLNDHLDEDAFSLAAEHGYLQELENWMAETSKPARLWVLENRDRFGEYFGDQVEVVLDTQPSFDEDTPRYMRVTSAYAQDAGLPGN